MNRYASHLRKWLAITLLTLAMCASLAYVWPDADSYYSASQAAAIAEQGEIFRLAKAAPEVCGPGKSWTLTDTPGQIQCLREIEPITERIKK